MNKVRDYRALEREYVTSQVSLRELCRRHDISAHSLVVVRARKGKWAEKREAYRAKADESFITRHADRMADLQAKIIDKALDAIDEALDKRRSDMRATEKKLVDREWVEVPVMRLKPNDVAILIDRLMVLFERPSVISQHQGLSVTTELSVDSLREFIEAARGGRIILDSGVPAAANTTPGRLATWAFVPGVRRGAADHRGLRRHPGGCGHRRLRPKW